MKDFDEPGFLAPTGLYLGGTKYMVIQGEAGAVIRGKKVFHIFTMNSFHNFSYDFKKKCTPCFYPMAISIAIAFYHYTDIPHQFLL